jgi:acyl-CoA thioester hydrolase
MGVIHHRHYLAWCEMGRTELMRQLGSSYAELESQGIHLAVSEIRFSYRASARYDDRVRVRTTLEKLRSRGVRFSYLVEDADTSAVLVRAETDHVCLDADGSSRKLPADTRELLKRAL